MLEPLLFKGCDQKKPTSRWGSNNNFRALVPKALTHTLGEIINPHIVESLPAIEIGSGIGYSFPREISSRIVRIQPNSDECQFLINENAASVYQLNIDDLCDRLLRSAKKISLFFALNVFDTLSREERKSSFVKLSQLQSEGDRLLILSDTNPLVNVLISEIESLNPGFAIWPYFPLKGECQKFTVLLVPIC